MRFALALAVAASMLVGCAKSSTTTAPVTSTLRAAGVWSGCLAAPASCSLSMTLTDSAVTDSTGTIKGTGNWISPVTIVGTRTAFTVTLHASQTGQTLGWEFSGVLSSGSLAGNMTGPSINASTQATFTRSP